MNLVIYSDEVCRVEPSCLEARGILIKLRGSSIHLFLGQDEAAELDRALRTIYPTLALDEDAALDKWADEHASEFSHATD